MSWYHICPHCGAHLDPGEVCDCHRGAEADEAGEQKDPPH